MARLIDIHLMIPWDNQDEWGLLSLQPTTVPRLPLASPGDDTKQLNIVRSEEREAAGTLLRRGDPRWGWERLTKKGQEKFISPQNSERTQACVTEILPALASTV